MGHLFPYFYQIPQSAFLVFLCWHVKSVLFAPLFMLSLFLIPTLPDHFSVLALTSYVHGHLLCMLHFFPIFSSFISIFLTSITILLSSIQSLHIIHKTSPSTISVLIINFFLPNTSGIITNFLGLYVVFLKMKVFFF